MIVVVLGGLAAFVSGPALISLLGGLGFMSGGVVLMAIGHGLKLLQDIRDELRTARPSRSQR
jgi:hypothetical protein